LRILKTIVLPSRELALTTSWLFRQTLLAGAGCAVCAAAGKAMAIITPAVSPKKKRFMTFSWFYPWRRMRPKHGARNAGKIPDLCL
jgi:hypothetical protein